MRTTLFQQIPNITFRQLWILSALNEKGMCWKDLRALNNWNDGALYGALISLDKKGFIAGFRGERSTTYEITNEGRAILDQIYEEVYSWKKKKVIR
jgi:DNA-binding PadR family transcriptional regulator